MSDLLAIQSQAEAAIEDAQSLEALEQLRIQYLGKKGEITTQMKTLGSLPPEERKTFGAQVNEAKQIVTDAIEAKKHTLEAKQLEQQLKNEVMDVTLPIRQKRKGHIHPISQVIEECTAIFAAQGFDVVDGPEIEDDFNNFTALNIPENHPARQMQDTFYLSANDDNGAPLVLRTHTSSVQIRAMQAGKPPFKIIAPGRVYRSDYDMTHTPMFHQIEGLYVDKDIHMGHLKGCLHQFLKAFFEVDDVPLQFRPSFFPFTEPSAEVDIACARKDGEVRIGEGDDWMEILGCGMVHPNVLKNVGIAPDEYQGFAFGVGMERLAMLKYGAPDLRHFFDSDMRWLSHYGFSAVAVGA